MLSNAISPVEVLVITYLAPRPYGSFSLNILVSPIERSEIFPTIFKFDFDELVGFTLLTIGDGEVETLFDGVGVGIDTP